VAGCGGVGRGCGLVGIVKAGVGLVGWGVLGGVVADDDEDEGVGVEELDGVVVEADYEHVR